MRQDSAEEAKEDAARRTAAADEDDGPLHTGATAPDNYIVLPTPELSHRVDRPARTPRYLCGSAEKEPRHVVDAFGLSFGTLEEAYNHMTAAPATLSDLAVPEELRVTNLVGREVCATTGSPAAPTPKPREVYRPAMMRAMRPPPCEEGDSG